MKLIRRVWAWWAGRKERRWLRGLPEDAAVTGGEWTTFDVGTLIDIASWTMPPRRQWPLAFPPGRVGSFPKRVAPEPLGPQAVRIVSKSPSGDLVAYVPEVGL